MQVEDLVKGASKLTDYEFKKRLDDLVINNYRYQNLSHDNRNIIMNLVRKHRSRIRQGGISSLTIKQENYNLYRKRQEFDLSDEDLRDIKEILNEFKK